MFFASKSEICEGGSLSVTQVFKFVLTSVFLKPIELTLQQRPKIL